MEKTSEEIKRYRNIIRMQNKKVKGIKLKIYYENNLFYVESDFTDNDLLRRWGFSWDKNKRQWCTPYAAVATKACKDEETRNLIVDIMLKENQDKRASNAIYSDCRVPAKVGLSYLPYQLAGVEYMSSKKSVLLADQMGLGKTIQVIGLINYLQSTNPKTNQNSISKPTVIIVCPASLKSNWLAEINKWLTADLTSGIADTKNFPKTDIVIINYDILTKLEIVIKSKVWDIAVFDECHYLKNDKAQRTKVICGYRNKAALQAKRKLALTGTPILNRPIELFPILKYLNPHGWPNKFEYAKRYCAAHKTRFGWDFTGSSNLEDLQDKLRRSIMIRRMKEEVLTDLPPKVRQIIELDLNGKDKTLMKQEQSLWSRVKSVAGISVNGILNDQEFRQAVKIMQGGSKLIFDELSTIRKENALAKLPLVIEHLKEAIDSSGKVICFCHHTEVVKEIKAAFSGVCVVLTGSTPLKQRQKAVRDFQTKQQIKLFIGNIQAAGVGLTLTASSHVVFAELSWVPGEISQCEDRAHRIGQKDSVLVQHLVLSGSIDAHMAKMIVRKQEVIEKALDYNVDEELMEMLS